MTEPAKFTRGYELGFYFTVQSGLEEDQVWYATVLPLLEGLPENDIDIWQYCVTEMVNNAIDHSAGSALVQMDQEFGDDGQMPRFVPVEELSKGRHFNQEIVVLCVRWYLSFKLSFRDLVAMMAERGIGMAHTTILRWVQHYTPEFEKRWKRFARSADLGGWTRPISASRGNGCTSIEQSTRLAR